jgi:hypothetical protein
MTSAAEDLLRDAYLEFVLDEEIDKLPPCEAVDSHPLGRYGHIIAQHATFMVGFPCGLVMMYCAGFVAHGPGTNLHCSKGCGALHRWETLTIVPLTNTN